MNKELAIKLVQKEIEVRRDFADKAEALCEVVRRFNGKVFNKRLETAMKEVYPVKVEQEFTFGSISITGWIEDRMVRSDVANRMGHHEVAYLKDSHIYIGIIRDAFDSDKRIWAEAIVAKILATAEYEKKTADEMESQLARIDDIIAERKRIYEEQQKFTHNTNWSIQEYFDLRF